MLGVEQYFPTCDGHGGRGIITGTGTIDGGVLDVPDFTLTCGAGASFTLVTIFALDRRNGTLIEDPDGNRRPSPSTG